MVTGLRQLRNQSNEMQTTSFGKVVLIAGSVVFKSAKKNVQDCLGKEAVDL